MTSYTLRISSFLRTTNVEGPGKRACLWVQGCDIRCPGCLTDFRWPINGGLSVNVDDVICEILNISNIEGVTFSGGEPFLQAKKLVKIVEGINDESDLSIVTYSGHYLEEIIEANKKDWNKLLSLTDILIDGPYNESLPSNHLWTGSSNQNIHFLSSKYNKTDYTSFEDSKKVEFHIRPDSTIILNGNITNGLLNILKNNLIQKK